MLSYVRIGRQTTPVGGVFAAINSADLDGMSVVAWVLTVLGVEINDLRAVTHGDAVAYFTTEGDAEEDWHAARLVETFGSSLTPRGPAIVLRTGDTAEAASVTADTLGVAFEAIGL
ncbi:hypothetical protein GS504_01410 [Rhodococcus hoagii]|nr:hypothetical protein [Prescottella equi]NKS71669.1 hypothetical protein [Prescottella equi]